MGNYFTEVDNNLYVEKYTFNCIDFNLQILYHLMAPCLLEGAEEMVTEINRRYRNWAETNGYKVLSNQVQPRPSHFCGDKVLLCYFVLLSYTKPNQLLSHIFLR